MNKLNLSTNSVFIFRPQELERVGDKVKKEIEKKIFQESQALSSEIGSVIKKRQSVKNWVRSRTGSGLHAVSKPGFPPNEDTGALRRGLFVKKTGVGIMLGVAVRAVKDYSGFLEYGTKRMLPRPYFYPTILSSLKRPRWKKAIRQIFFLVQNSLEKEAFKKAMRRHL